MRLPLWRRRQDADLDDEIRSHLDMAVRDRMERGESRAQAEAAARREFGNVGLVKEVTRAAWGWTNLETFFQDLRYGLRMLVRSPGFTATAMLTLALGIGANTAIFSEVNAVLLRALPFPRPERLVRVYEKRPKEDMQRNAASRADFLDWKQQSQTIPNMAAYVVGTTIATDGRPETLFGVFTAGDVFRVLGVPPLAGRFYGADEDYPKNAPVVVISERLWGRRFGGDPAAVGRTITLDGSPFTIVGVAPDTMQKATSMPEAVATLDVWLPGAIKGAQAADRGLHTLNVVGRLRHGLTLEAARAEMDAIAARLERQYADISAGHGVFVAPLQDELVLDARKPLWVLFGAVLLVLLIACANVASLLLTRNVARAREIAIRAALGATRLRIVRQYLTETVLLAVLGGGLGLALGYALLRALVRLTPMGLLPPDAIRLDPVVLAFVFALSLLTAAIFGFAPAWLAARNHLAERLKDASLGLSTGPGRNRLRNLLVVCELTLAVLLLVGSGLLIRSFYVLRQVDPGFDANRAVVANLALPGVHYRTPDQLRGFYDRLLPQLSAVPGVESAAAINLLPLSGMDARRGFRIENRNPGETPTRAHPRIVTSGYFQTMRIPLVSGRGFGEADVANAPLVVVINQAGARRYFPGENPVGRRIAMGGGDPPPWRTIVGVVADVKHWGLDAEVAPEMYFPFPQSPSPFMTLTARCRTDCGGVPEALRSTVAALDRELPPAKVVRLEEVASRSVAERRFSMALLALFAGIALALAAIGVYGMLAYSVAQRTREIGIRIALGAKASQVVRMVLAEVAGLVAAGCVAGMAAALALTGVLRSLLFHVKPTDPLTYAAVVGVLVAVAVLATVVPALRATRVDPMVALRYE